MMIETESRGDIRVIALARAEKRNAMLPEMLDELLDAIAESEDARAIVLIGRGKTFCSGFDLKACAQDESGETLRSLLTGLSACISAMRRCKGPVVLGAQGAAVAGGCALLGGADVVVADRSVKLGYPVVRIGISPAISAPFMLASMRPGVVRSRLLDSDLVDGERACSLGLVDELVETPDAVESRAIELAETLASKPGIGCIATKAWLNTVAPVDEDIAKLGLNTSLSLTGSEEEHERLLALWK